MVGCSRELAAERAIALQSLQKLRLIHLNMQKGREYIAQL